MTEQGLLGNNHSNLIESYKKNKNNDWKTWLENPETFAKAGKQGLVGTINILNKRNHKYVFKISQYINYLIQHENTVMEGLNEISTFCPHFCKTFGIINCKINPYSRKEGDPFDITNVKYPIYKEVLLCNYLEKSCKFYNYIRAKPNKISEEILFSTIKQVLLSLVIAQNKKKFTHYDLHSNNIMMKKCNKDLVFLYVLDEENQFVVPTLGHYPVVIDFGFSFIENMEDGPLWASMGHTDVGFMSDRFDWVADPKLFLVTVAEELREKRETKNSKKLQRIVKNLFYPLNIDWLSGWDEDNKKSVSDHVTEMLAPYNTESKLFQEYDHYCIDLLQSLIILPLETQDYDNIEVSYQTFMKEWLKIENQIGSAFYNLYILKGIVDAARFVRAGYTEYDSRANAICTFREKVFERIDEVSKFCNIKNIHYEKLLCSLYVLSRNIEGIYYELMNKQMREKEKQYKKLPLKNIEQIYAAIECNLEDSYIYKENTIVYIINSLNNTSDIYQIPKEQIENINTLHPIARGTFIYDLYNNK
jgi:hypothetical protein